MYCRGNPKLQAVAKIFAYSKPKGGVACLVHMLQLKLPPYCENISPASIKMMAHHQ